MNSLERFNGMLAGQTTDRRPFTLVLSLYGARLTGCPLDQHYADPAAYARGQAAVRETFGPDVLFAPICVALIGAAFGAELRHLTHNAPTIKAPLIASAQAWERLRFPDPDAQPHLRFVRESLQRMVAEHRNEIPVAALLLPPLDIPLMILGMDTWLETVLFDLPLAERIVRSLIPFFVVLANRCFEDGAAYLILPSAFVSPGIVPRDLVERFSRPLLAEALAQLRGPVALHHLDHPLLPHLDLLAGLPAVSAFSLASSDDLHRARAVVGPLPVLLSGPDTHRLNRSSTAEITALCAALLADRCEDRRFLLCNAGADVLFDTPPENIHAVRRAVESFAGDRS